MLSRSRARLRLMRAKTRGTVGFLGLVVALLRGRVEEIWIGDSHSVLLNTPRFPFPPLAPVDGHRWVWHLGPRVMYSIARDDFPQGLRGTARVLRRIPATRRVTWFFSFGEIDIRCHLATQLRAGGDLTFVSRYVDHVRGFSTSLGGAEVVVVVPVPPSVDVLDHSAFPVVGSADERIAAHRAVREQLAEAATGPGPHLRLLDLTPVLSEPSGLMRDEFTDDGCHTNEAGRAVSRQAVGRFLQLT